MEGVVVIVIGIGVIWMAAAAARASWLRGWKSGVIIAFLIVVALSALFFWLSARATGGHIPGLGEVLIAFALLMGPGAGILLGLIAAWSMPIAIGVAVLYGSVVALAWSNI